MGRGALIMATVPNHYRSVTNGRPAHEGVTIQSATALWLSTVPVDWPVSGDESRIAHGYIGMRHAQGCLWAA